MFCQSPMNSELSDIETVLDKCQGDAPNWDDVNAAYMSADEEITNTKSEYNEQLQQKDDHIKDLESQISALKAQVGAREDWEKEQEERMRGARE